MTKNLSFEELKYLIELKKRNPEEYYSFIKDMFSVSMDFVKLFEEMEEELKQGVSEQK